MIENSRDRPAGAGLEGAGIVRGVKSLARARGPEDVISHAGALRLRESGGRLVLTERDGLSE